MAVASLLFLERLSLASKEPWPEWNLLTFLMHYDPSDIGSLILIVIFPNKRILRVFQLHSGGSRGPNIGRGERRDEHRPCIAEKGKVGDILTVILNERRAS